MREYPSVRSINLNQGTSHPEGRSKWGKSLQNSRPKSEFVPMTGTVLRVDAAHSFNLMQLHRALLFLTIVLSALLGSTLSSKSSDLPPAARVLLDLDDERPIGWYMDYLIDDGNLLIVEDMASPEISDRFQPALRDTPYFGQTDASIWLRFRIDTRNTQLEHTLLTLPRPMTDRVDVFYDRGQGYEVVSRGLQVESTRSSSFKSYVFDLPKGISPQNPVYIKVVDKGLVSLPFLVQGQKRFVNTENTSSIILGITVGVLVLLMIGVLVGYSRAKMTSSLWLFLSILFITFFISSYSGFITSQLPQYFLSATVHLGIFGMLLSPLALAMFVTSFYEQSLQGVSVRLWLGALSLSVLATMAGQILNLNILGSGAILSITLAILYTVFVNITIRRDRHETPLPAGTGLVMIGTFALIPGVFSYVALENIFDAPPWVAELGYFLITLGSVCLYFGNDRKVNSLERQEKVRLENAAGRLQAVFETANDALFVLDSKGKVVEANLVAEELFGMSEHSMIGRQAIDMIIPPSLRMGHRQALKRYIETGEGYFKNGRTETRGQNAGGETFPIMMSMSTIIIDQSPFFALRVSEADDSAVPEISPALQGRYDLAFQATGDVLTEWDAQTENVFTSHAYENIFGLQSDYALKSSTVFSWEEIIHPDDLDEIRRLSIDMRRGKLLRADITYRIYHGLDTSLRWIRTSAAAETDNSGRVIRIATVSRDITDRQEREQQLSQEAFHDSLTGLSNRARLIERLKHLISRHNQGLESNGIIMIINIDRFQQINDNLGHSAGDEFLIIVARRIEKFAGTEKTLARLEGDTFALLIEGDDDAGGAQVYARSLQDEITQPVFLQGQEIFPSVSIGIAQLGYRHNRAEEALSDAHRALSQGREQSAGRIKVFGLNTKASNDGRLALEASLHHALSREELVLHYQPIVDLETSELAGFEALMRWEHPQHGLISPYRFIPIAEETGLITEMGAWALTEACSQVSRWKEEHPDQPDFFISINVSARQFVDHDLVADVEAALAISRIDPSLVKLEITEGLIMENPEFAAVVLEKFKGLGVKLSIDDFGTGYSSLSYLHRFPFDVLKIDRSFVSTMLDKQQSEVIIRSIASLAHNLEMEIVAEGAEKIEQINKLHELGCEFVQGYYFGKPVNSDQASLWFTNPNEAMENPPRKRA